MSAEAPRLETPCQVKSGTVVLPNATRPCQGNSRRPTRGVARPWRPRHRGRCHGCSRAWPQTGRCCCAPASMRGATRSGSHVSQGVRFAPRAEARTASSSIRCGIRSRLTHKVTENTARPPCLLGARFLAPSRARAAWGADPDRRHQELLRGDQWARINRQFAESPAGLRHPSSARNSRLLGNGERYCVDEFTD